MTVLFIDSSVIIAIAFNESTAAAARRRLRDADRVLAAPLLEAEVRAAFCREERAIDETLFAPLEWILLNRGLGTEIARVLDAGYARGADCWHLATALFATPSPAKATFYTFDVRQKAVAKALGFRV